MYPFLQIPMILQVDSEGANQTVQADLGNPLPTKIPIYMAWSFVSSSKPFFYILFYISCEIYLRKQNLCNQIIL